jgi:hypothetical protein
VIVPADSTPVLLLALLGAAAVLAIGCGGSSDLTPSDSDTPGKVASIVSPTDSPPSGPSPSPPLAADGITGASVPPPMIESAKFDSSRVSENAGSFPALTDPEFVSAGTVDWMSFDDLVLGAVQGDESRAYPLSMMTYHHVVNDTLGGSPYLVTF